uniref:Uncharacterized protein n=1 Tax=Romanomermis culicivorax TaxID=13658 RepID=A0A915JXJ7_ROMCU
MIGLNSNFSTMVTGLSSPFRHVEKYPNLLQEIERHLQEHHPDRGDTQRAVSVYRDLANSCNDIRKQKETQMELLSCVIKDWTGPVRFMLLASFGGILYAKSVSISHGDESEWKEKFLTLFAKLLLVLNVSSDMDSYIFERKIDLSGTSVKKMPKNESCPLSSHQNILTISRTQDSEIILKLLLSSYEETNKWLHSLEKAGVFVEESTISSKPNDSISAKAYSTVQNHQVPQSQKLEVSLMPSPGYAEMISKKTCSLSNVHSLVTTSDSSSKHLPLNMVKAKNQFTPESSYQQHRAVNLPRKKFSGFCIRPLPPYKLYNVRSATESNQIKMRKKGKDAVIQAFILNNIIVV